MTQPGRVALVRCESYDEARVEAAVSEGISLLGGVGAFASSGERILLKPNVLQGDNPLKCVTTHPSVFKAVASAFKKAGARLSWGDSPAVGSLSHHGARCGLTAVANELGIGEADFSTCAEVVSDRTRWMRRLPLCKGVLEADGVVNLPKLKTHGLLRYTGALKNMLGCVPGLRKSEFHLKLPDPARFAWLLVDLNMHVRPRLHVMDAVVAMEGKGPRSGAPRPIGALILSRDPVALDMVACRIIGMPESSVPTFEAAREAGLSSGGFESIEIAGGRLEDFACPDFKADRSAPRPLGGGPALVFLKNRISPRPEVSGPKCVRCGNCVAICPAIPKAMSLRGGSDAPPSVRADKCIRCFCCIEVCPEGAISIRTPLLVRLTRKLGSVLPSSSNPAGPDSGEDEGNRAQPG